MRRTLTLPYLPLEPDVIILSTVMPSPISMLMESAETMSSVGTRSPMLPSRSLSSTSASGENIRV